MFQFFWSFEANYMKNIKEKKLIKLTKVLMTKY